MTKNSIFALVLALPLAGYACEPNSAADEAGERAEEAAEEQAEEAGYGPVDQQIQGEIAEERAELAHDVNAEAPEGEPGLTAAQRIDAVEDGEAEETGF
jgi:hypothetical protein